MGLKKPIERDGRIVGYRNMGANSLRDEEPRKPYKRGTPHKTILNRASTKRLHGIILRLLQRNINDKQVYEKLVACGFTRLKYCTINSYCVRLRNQHDIPNPGPVRKYNERYSYAVKLMHKGMKPLDIYHNMVNNKVVPRYAQGVRSRVHKIYKDLRARGEI